MRRSLIGSSVAVGVLLFVAFLDIPAPAPTPAPGQDGAASGHEPSPPTDATLKALGAAQAAQAAQMAESMARAEPSRAPVSEVTLAVVGDILLDRRVADQIDLYGTDAVLAGVRDELRAADLTVGNLETPLGTERRPIAKNFSFLSDPDTVDVLTDGGFDLVTLANNHILDQGVNGMRSTQRILDEEDIAHVGVGDSESAAHEPTTIEAGGQRLAFLGYFQIAPENSDIDYTRWISGPDTPGVAWADPDRISQDVTKAQADADHVIVMLHSGRELGSTELTNGQEAAGQAALDAGATAVLGAHPHVLQSWEWSDEQFVAWSLGNFVFDFPNNTPQTESAILHLTLDTTGVTDVTWTPVRIVDTFPKAQDPNGDGARIQQTIDALENQPD